MNLVALNVRQAVGMQSSGLLERDWFLLLGWLRGTALERRSFVGGLSLSCT